MYQLQLFEPGSSSRYLIHPTASVCPGCRSFLADVMVKVMWLPFEKKIEGGIDKTRDYVLMPVVRPAKNIVYPTLLFHSLKTVCFLFMILASIIFVSPNSFDYDFMTDFKYETGRPAC